MSKKQKQYKSTAQVNALSSVKKMGKKKKLKRWNIKSDFAKDTKTVKDFTSKKEVKKSPGKLKRKKSQVSKVTHLKEIEERKPVGFGAASSDSEWEPIDASWNIDLNKDKCSSWEPASSEPTRVSSVDSEISDDLENSESDYDDELDDDLQSMNSSNEQHSLASSEEESVDIRTSDKDGSPYPNSTNLVNTKKPNKCNRSSPLDVTQIHSTETKKSLGGDAVLTSQVESVLDKDIVENPIIFSTLTLTNKSSLFEEIRRRAMDLASRSLYVSPIPPDCNLERLRQLSPEITSCRLSYNPVKKNCRKYAFLEYADPVVASAAKKSITGRLFAGHNVSVQPVRPQVTDTCDWSQVDSQQLFISGLHSDVTRVDLHRVFPKAELDYPFHSAGFPLGYAVAKFVNDAVAFESFIKAHQRPIRGQLIFVNYVIRPARLTGSKNSNATPTASVTRIAKSTATETPVDKAQPLRKSGSTEADLSSRSDHIIIANSHLPSANMDPTPAKVYATKPKVLIQPITDEMTSDENEENVTCSAESNDLFTRLSKFDGQHDNEVLLHKRQQPVYASSHILTSLFGSRKRQRSCAESNELVSSKKAVEASDEQESEEDEDDVSAHSTGSTASDKGENETESLEQDDEDTESSAEEDDDDDHASHSDGSKDEDDEDDDLDEASFDDEPVEESKHTADSSTTNPTSILFTRPMKAYERAAMNEEQNSSDLEIDRTLQTVLLSRRAAMRAVKTAGSKRLWSSDFPKKKQKNPTKFNTKKPFELPVPSKRRKL